MDPNEGLRLLLTSATEGCVPAMSELGYIYLEGHYGVPVNRPEALKWIRLAANAGWANAQFNLGYCYERGLGLQKTLPKPLHGIVWPLNKQTSSPLGPWGCATWKDVGCGATFL